MNLKKLFEDNQYVEKIIADYEQKNSFKKSQKILNLFERSECICPKKDREAYIISITIIYYQLLLVIFDSNFDFLKESIINYYQLTIK